MTRMVVMARALRRGWGERAFAVLGAGSDSAVAPTPFAMLAAVWAELPAVCSAAMVAAVVQADDQEKCDEYGDGQ
ncbi:hypothetical protein ACBR40_44550 [Nonomuraea sp. AD125B]|uniref:hypothetical protein n=1 Tax=Nonomuraea sp. AD125B TaxID=3242897 RepID=UPI0035288809